MSGQAFQAQPFAGFVTRVESYTTLVATVIQPATRLLRYGALALVEDHSDPQSVKRYLALVTDVREASPAPAVNEQAVQQLLRQVLQAGAPMQSLHRLLQQVYSPSQGLIRWFSVRELSLRLLGELDQQGRLVEPERPPRPQSIVAEPPTSLLQQLLDPGPRGIPLGELAYNPGVAVKLDPQGLSTHLAVIGQTGSGKSETVKRLVAEYAFRKHLFAQRGGVVVLDVSGEYTGYPYQPPSGVTLLDAALNPAAFAQEPGLGAWLQKTPKTILVPYDLSTLSLHAAADMDYAARVSAFAAEIASRHPGTRVEVLVYGRHGIYHANPGGKPRLVGRDEAARLLRCRGVLLVVAAPLPDTLTVEEVAALSGSRSEQLPLALAEVADRIGVLDLDTVVSVSGLQAIVDLYNKLLKASRQRSSNPQGEAAKKLVEFVDAFAALVARGVKPEEAARKCAGRHGLAGFIPAKALHNLLLLPILQDRPDAPRDAAATRQALSERHPDPSRLWEESLLEGIQLASWELSGLHHSTFYSLLRGLKRVSRMVSPLLDAGQYRLLAQRIYQGFTLIHLAYPSRGNTSTHVARLLDELYEVASTGYQPGQQTLIVVEEAHNHAPAGEETPSGRALLRIAREGRKYGLSLVLVSQRPGFIDQNVLSQAASLIALRVTNPDDLAALRRSVESTSEEMVDRLPDLEPGHAVVSGPALPQRRIPVLARVEMLAPHRQPAQAGGGGGAGAP